VSKLRVPFTTTIDKDALKAMKKMALEEECHVNDLIEKAFEVYKMFKKLKKDEK